MADSYHLYHSALAKGRTAEASPVDRIEFPDGVAFVADITDGLPEEYAGVDALWIEPPWRRGFPLFQSRAGATGSWGDFLDALGALAAQWDRPLFVITGADHKRHMPAPDNLYETRLNNDPVKLLCYNAALMQSQTAEFALEEVCARYSVIGDPCCGYGRTVWAARRAGKRFVVSDYNATAIGVIAQEFG